MDKFEQRIRELTEKINGQYPRPWMTDLKDPSCAEVFIVGSTQATAYRSDCVDYERFIDSLFNRNDQRCREFYEEYGTCYAGETKPSLTRINIEMFTLKLKKVGVYSVLETNVVCYGGHSEYKGSVTRGKEIFRTLIREIRPKAVILHGVGVCDEFCSLFDLSLQLRPPNTKDEFVQKELDLGSQVFVIPSLAPPESNKWQNWRCAYLNEVAKRVCKVVESGD